ncbi:hypothetical protein [Radiobacillus deserti]|uniref:hypothetical protein n=1 Tax=Radiobacillus deserti TaxID=2594883 RepID=UPI0013153DF1|nr:hypothetical protein [Radiobacillus deserti]
MNFKYVPLKRWKKEGSSHLFYVMLGMATFYISAKNEGTISMLLFITSGSLFLSGLYHAIYYFRLPDKDYVRINDAEIIIYRGSFSKKRILFSKISKAVEMDRKIVIHIGSPYYEEIIYTEWLSEADVRVLRRELFQKVPEEAIK